MPLPPFARTLWVLAGFGSFIDPHRFVSSQCGHVGLVTAVMAAPVTLSSTWLRRSLLPSWPRRSLHHLDTLRLVACCRHCVHRRRLGCTVACFCRLTTLRSFCCYVRAILTPGIPRHRRHPLPLWGGMGVVVSRTTHPLIRASPTSFRAGRRCFGCAAGASPNRQPTNIW